MAWLVAHKNGITSIIGFLLTASVTALGLCQTYSVTIPSYLSIAMVFINAFALGLQGLLIGKYPDKKVKARVR